MGDREMRKGATTLALILISMGCATADRSELDAEVRRLCAVDGGIKIYQTVNVQAEKFNQWGQITFFRPDEGENALGSDYIYKWTKFHYRQGQPALDPTQVSMARDHVQVMRRVDGKLLGELVVYHRAGGDSPGPWMPSSYTCPEGDQSRETVLFRRIFVREPQ